MNVLKVFTNDFDAGYAQEVFCLDNFFRVETSDKHGKVKLVNGDSVSFLVITQEPDFMKICGYQFSWVEFKGVVAPEIKNYILTRIRG